MPIKIDLGAWSSVFAVPSKVVDEGLKFADGSKLRLLLYVLRNCGNELDFEKISKDTGVNIADIPEILDYWVSMGVFAKINDTYLPAESDNTDYSEDFSVINDENSSGYNAIKENSAPIASNDNIEKKEAVKRHFTVSKPQKPDYGFTAQRLAVDEELKFIISEAQSYLGKTLSNSDASAFIMLKDTCGLPIDVILMLIQYCISIDKGNMRTIEKIGVGWADDGIYTIEAAENRIKKIKQTNINFSIVSSAFGLKNAGSPTKKQLEYGDKWVEEWKFSPEMLREAYERCVDTKGSMNFRYIDGILKRWNSNNIKNIEELRKFENTAQKQQSKRKSSYDIDELEKINTLDNLN